MSSFFSKLKTGSIGAGLFCAIFSLQWVILDVRPAGIVYIPPLLVGFLLGLVIHHFKIKWEQEAAGRSAAEIKAIRENAGTVCHKLGQPLQALQTGVDLMMMDTPKTDAAYDDLKAMSSEIRRIKSITGKLEEMTENNPRAYLNSQIVDIEDSSPSKGDPHGH